MRKSLKRMTLLVGLGAVAFVSKAQQDPYYSHFKFIKQAYNPAAVGEKDDYICANAVAHNQWIGFDDQTWVDRETGENLLDPNQVQYTENVAPVTLNFNIGGQIVNNKSKIPMAGVGFSVWDDRIGYMKTTAFKGQGAFFLPIQGDFARLSIGAELGFTQFGFVNPQWRARDAGDVRIPPGGVNDMRFDIGAGVYYKQSRLGQNIKDFYVGASLSHITGAKYNLNMPSSGSNDFQLDQHIFIHTGANVEIGSGANVLEPAVLIKYNSKPQVDLNLTVLNNKMFRAGVGYRQWLSTDALTILLGYVKDQMQFGYSYDITMSKIQTVSNGTHEIYASYCFQFQSKPPPPKIYKKTAREL